MKKKQTGWFNLNIAEYAFLFWWLRLLSQSFYKNKLSTLFEEGKTLEDEIKNQLEEIKYEKN